MHKKLISFFVFLAFFIPAFLVRNDYGISWDEPTHFKRGHAYLNYFLTGQKNYSNLPIYPSGHKRSLYQVDGFNAEYFFQNDSGHPPLNGIISALFNQIFYIKLDILDDVRSFQLFEILVSALGVVFVFNWAWEAFGIWPAIYSSIILGTYPLYWSESHFNIKDPVQAVLYTAALYYLWKFVEEKKHRFLIFSSVFAALTFSTKFNILFAPFIVLPWLTALLVQQKSKLIKLLISKKTILYYIFSIFVFIIIFISTWPFLWHNSAANVLSIFGYYKEIGTEHNMTIRDYLFGWNFYALKWIIYSTFPEVLLLFATSLLLLKNEWKKRSSVLLLWFLFFAVPVLRVMVPGSSIYGGVRQIMEYIPGLALLAGYGAYQLSKFDKKAKYYLLLFLLIASVYRILIFHPNENVYFNFLSGGLDNQVDAGFQAAGNSFGNAYKQGVDWLNQNAPPNSKVALVQGTVQNIPGYWFRNDLSFSNNYWSGILREGEYMMEVTYNYETRVYHYAWEYLYAFLNPVYEVKVDGAAILIIWKNDWEHTKPELKLYENNLTEEINTSIIGNSIFIKLSSEFFLSRIKSTHEPSCIIPQYINVATSQDGVNWIYEEDKSSQYQLPQELDTDANTFQFFFAGKKAQYIKYDIYEPSCLSDIPRVELVVLTSDEPK